MLGFWFDSSFSLLFHLLEFDMTTKIVPVACRCCGGVYCLEVNTEGFACWQSGELIQNALPELSAEDRELLISKTCDTCWKNLFGDDEE